MSDECKYIRYGNLCTLNKYCESKQEFKSSSNIRISGIKIYGVCKDVGVFE